MTEKIYIFDTTLRDGEQSPGATMNTAEKLRIAAKLEKLGVDIIEAGFPCASKGDFDAVRKIAEQVKESIVCGLARITPSDITAAGEAVKVAAQPMIHTFVSTSDIHLQYQLKLTKEQVLENAIKGVKHAKNYCDKVEFSAMDASRSDPEYLCRVFEAAIKAGATIINIPDTVGYAIPSEFEKLVSYVMNHTPNIDKAIVSVHCHNDLGLATANSLAAVKAGARQVECTINGIGERAGNTSMEEIVMAIHTRGDYLNLRTDIITEKIYSASRLVSTITGIMVQPNKAIVGANAFAHESGIHQDGVLKNPMTYEIMKPETIGLSSNHIVLGKHSGRHALRTRLEELGYKLTLDELNTVFENFKALSDKKKEILDEDIEALVTEGVLRSAEVFKLDYIQVSSGSTVIPTATIEMSIKDRKVRGTCHGNGPIDAAFNTIVDITGASSELLRFSISALTGGADAQGEVTVRLREKGLIALGRGSDSDIITASAKAYVNGLNRLEYLKANPVNTPETI
ncbi:MAG: 2-isopropylmalate synthase [Proteobacteria bacterium]|nr:2-isopropylmalate synthase [Pseudomonadota bacterium]